MKDKYGKPDTCNKCVHYTVSTQICGETKESPFAYETCPCPSKIQAPKKDHWEEIAEYLDRLSYDYRGASSQSLDGFLFSESAIKFIKKYWPKDKPKGDIDKAWFQLCKIIPMNQDRFKEALKAGGFI